MPRGGYRIGTDAGGVDPTTPDFPNAPATGIPWPATRVPIPGIVDPPPPAGTVPPDSPSTPTTATTDTTTPIVADLLSQLLSGGDSIPYSEPLPQQGGGIGLGGFVLLAGVGLGAYYAWTKLHKEKRAGE